MSAKDYYKVLQIPVGSDSTSIKKAFRKLALEYHPDKKGTSVESTAHFREIQEAYETLSDPYKKELYLFKRWLNQAHDIHQEKASSAEEFVSQLLKAEQFLSGVDASRLDPYILLDYLKNLLHPDQLMLVKEKNDQNIKNEIIRLSYQLCILLDSDSSRAILNQFNSVLRLSDHQEQEWKNEIIRKKKKENWEKRKIPIVILLTVLICWLIFKITR